MSSQDILGAWSRSAIDQVKHPLLNAISVGRRPHLSRPHAQDLDHADDLASAIDAAVAEAFRTTASLPR
jgi:hypothetical protein